MRTTVTLTCVRCGRTFDRWKATHEQAMKRGRKIYCSPQCNSLDLQEQSSQTISCDWCRTEFTKVKSQIRKHNFCGHRCAALYSNTHKTTGTRRSKLEVWLEERLRERYPDLAALFNAKGAIGSELDIHFPSLDLAFELNGIFHYEPIYGSEKLASIQNNDHRKFLACVESGIELCVIDVSWINYFKPARGQRILDILVGVVDAKIRRRVAESNG